MTATPRPPVGPARIPADERSRLPSGTAEPLRRGLDGVSPRDEALVLPVGTVTFLLTDVEGSTRLWEDEDDGAMRAAVARHDAILAEAIERHDGVRPQEQGEGDSMVAAFARPTDALAAAVEAQAALAAEPWPTSAPLLVRMAVHTGEAHLRDAANYAGQSIIRTARLRDVGHGGQVLVSGATRDLAVDQAAARFALRPLGEHRLRDLGRPEQVWQLVVPGAPDAFDELATLDTVPNSLPQSLSPFIGRDQELTELADLVRAERLVTVTGSGGAGKTRLAQQVAASLVDEFPAGVWWVELAPLDGRGVEAAVRAAFGISQGSQAALEEAVLRVLDDAACLLVVDNCEHVSGAVASLLDRLLRKAPTLRVLATSRVLLDLPGEQAWRVPAMRLPEPSSPPTPEVLSRFDAVALFCDRARRARPNFTLTVENGPEVAQICRRLDGIPLAIELAAARTRLLDPRRILQSLDDALRILAGGSRAVMPRQQTLEASIAWSHDLLSPTEQTLLRRLSVFVDGWTLDLAEAICPDPDPDPGPGAEGAVGAGLTTLEVFDALDRLVDHSLVHTTDTPGGLRFGMLETIRQYALRRLADDPAERDAVLTRHSRHLTDWAASLRDGLLVGGSAQLIAALGAERANLLAATDRAIADGDPSRAVEALVALVPVLDLWTPMVSALLGQLDRVDRDPDLERACAWRSLLVRERALQLRGDVSGQLEALSGLVAAAESEDDAAGVAVGRLGTLVVVAFTGTPVFDELGEVLSTLEAHDPSWAIYGRAYVAALAAYFGHVSLAERHLEAVVPRIRGPVVGAVADLASGILSFARGDAADARRALEAALGAPHTSQFVENIGWGYLGFVGADLGIDLTEEAERRFRHSCEVEGNALRGVFADAMVAIRHLLADDLVQAERSHRRSLATAATLGIPMSWPYEHYALVAAAGIEAVVEGAEGSLTMDAVDHRCWAETHLRAGDVPAALASAHEALALARPEGAHRSVLLTLECTSRILVAAGRHTEATRVRGACAAFRAERSTVPYPCLQRLLDEADALCLDALGPDEHRADLADGATLSLDAAAEYATRLRATQATATVGWDALTPTEARVAELVAEGLTNPQVATELLMGPETVKTHLSRVFQKVGVANRKELIVAASRRAAERHR